MTLINSNNNSKKNRCVVRLKTETYWDTNYNLVSKKVLRHLKRKSDYYLTDIIDDPTTDLIQNLEKYPDGVYEVVPIYEPKGYYSCGDEDLLYIILKPYKE